MALLLLLILAYLVYAILDEINCNEELPACTLYQCPGCHASVSADWLVCPQCQALLQKSCHRCRKSSTAAHRYCIHCGQDSGRTGP